MRCVDHVDDSVALVLGEHLRLAQVAPFAPRKTLVLGAKGQFGRALCAELGEASHIECATHDILGVTAVDFDALRQIGAASVRLRRSGGYSDTHVREWSATR